MRYWHPLSQETAMLVNDFAPDEVFLLPLYPQFSTTTTGSSVRMWREACRIARLDVPTRLLCCYPTESRFIATMAAGLRVAHAEARSEKHTSELPSLMRISYAVSCLK